MKWKRVWALVSSSDEEAPDRHHICKPHHLQCRKESLGVDGQYAGECDNAGLQLPTHDNDFSLPISEERVRVSWLSSFLQLSTFNAKNMKIHQS